MDRYPSILLLLLLLIPDNYLNLIKNVVIFTSSLAKSIDQVGEREVTLRCYDKYIQITL